MDFLFKITIIGHKLVLKLAQNSFAELTEDLLATQGMYGWCYIRPPKQIRYTKPQDNGALLRFSTPWEILPHFTSPFS